MTLRSQICEHTFCFYYELGMYMLNRRMFQRGKDNKFFWFHKQSNLFFNVKVYLCYIKENSMTVNEAHLIYFSPTHTSKQVAEAIVHGTGIKNILPVNVTLQTTGEAVIPASALAIISSRIWRPCSSFGNGTFAEYSWLGYTYCVGCGLWQSCL